MLKLCGFAVSNYYNKVVTKKAYGRDFIDEFLPEAKAYLKRVGERPHAQKVNADRKAASDAYAAAKAAKK